MILSGYVPNSFGDGVIVPIPKGDKRNNNVVSDFRGITISNIVSKIFEHCLLIMTGKYLHSSERQFGFKKGVGCQHAIYSMRKIVDYYTERGSTVNVCSLDLASAFEKINHIILFEKLMNRNFPKNILAILINWYKKLFSIVKWGCSFSAVFSITIGMRQGSVLSPSIFAVYVDDVLRKLEKCKLGCYIKNVCMNSLCYADDF